MRIAIIGTGVGGLAAALACTRAGVDFELFDRAQDPLEGGVALTLWPNALNALKDLGAFDKGADWLNFIHEGSLRTPKNANLYVLPLEWMQAKYGFLPACVRRSTLTANLYEVLGRPAIHLARCDGIIQNGNQVTVKFSNGVCRNFDGVIAADGIHSAIRTQFEGESIRTVSYTAWRGIATNPAVTESSMREYVGPGIRFGYANINSSETYWFATVNNRLLGSESRNGWQGVAGRFSDFPAAVHSCIENTPVQDVVQSTLQEVLPGVSMARGNVALLGDAAHAITPNLGLGGCMATEDAKGLLLALQSDGSLSQVFESYARNRRARVRGIANFTRYLGKATQTEQLPLIWLRNATMKAVPSIIKNTAWAAILG